MNKFKFGDRVRCLENVEDLLKIGETYLIDSVMEDFLYIKTIHKKFTVGVCETKIFELVERKIGDKWYKAEELNEDGIQCKNYTLPDVDISKMRVAMSNEGTNVMKQEEETVHEYTKKIKLKVNDKVRCIYNLHNGIENNIFYLNEINGEYCNITSFEKNFLTDIDNVEFIARKIGDKWYKEEELKEYAVSNDPELNKGGSRLSVGYKINTEVKEEEKEESKVNKLGWYESKNGEKFKVVHIKNNENRPVIAFNENDECYNFSKEGFYHNQDMSSDCDLVKYLGPELTKEPRMFYFEVYISSNILEDKLDSLKYIHLTQEGLNNPIKFKLTMKEILE